MQQCHFWGSILLLIYQPTAHGLKNKNIHVGEQQGRRSVFDIGNDLVARQCQFCTCFWGGHKPPQKAEKFCIFWNRNHATWWIFVGANSKQVMTKKEKVKILLTIHNIGRWSHRPSLLVKYWIYPHPRGIYTYGKRCKQLPVLSKTVSCVVYSLHTNRCAVLVSDNCKTWWNHNWSSFNSWIVLHRATARRFPLRRTINVRREYRVRMVKRTSAPRAARTLTSQQRAFLSSLISHVGNHYVTGCHILI